MLSGADDFMALYKHSCKEAAEGKSIPDHSTKFKNRGSPGRQKGKFRCNFGWHNFLLVSGKLELFLLNV